jgi:hypothetical protein
MAACVDLLGHLGIRDALRVCMLGPSSNQSAHPAAHESRYVQEAFITCIHPPARPLLQCNLPQNAAVKAHLIKAQT